MASPDPFDATRARVEKTDRFARRMLAACLIFCVVLIVVASIGLGFALQRVHDDTATITQRQLQFHRQNVAQQKDLLCQTRAIDEILKALPEIVTGQLPPALNGGVSC